MQRFTRVAVAAGLVVTLMVAGVQGAAVRDPIVLRVLNWSQEQQGFYAEVADAFGREHPWITLEWRTLLQKRYDLTLPVLFDTGEAPDVFFYRRPDPAALAELLERGWVAPLAPDGVEVDDWMRRFPRGSFVEGVNLVDGRPYSFPFQDNVIWGPGYLYYNASVLEAADLDAGAVPRTWNAMRATCRTVRERTGGFCLAVPTDSPANFLRTWNAIAGSIRGDDFFDYRTGRFAAHDPLLLRAFEFIRSLFDDGHVAPAIRTKSAARQALATGVAAFYFDGPWLPSVLSGQLGLDLAPLRAAPPPVPDDGPRGALLRAPVEQKVWVSSQSSQREAAWLFVEWITRTDGFFATEYVGRGFGSLSYADNAKLLPVDEAVWRDILAVSRTLRVARPEPIAACPDMGRSRALLDARSLDGPVEVLAMLDAIRTGTPYAARAEAISDRRNAALAATLSLERRRGLAVSERCLAFPEWRYGETYDPAGYKLHALTR